MIRGFHLADFLTLANSLSDVISFGVAPAVLAYAAGLTPVGTPWRSSTSCAAA